MRCPHSRTFRTGGGPPASAAAEASGSLLLADDVLVVEGASLMFDVDFSGSPFVALGDLTCESVD